MLCINVYLFIAILYYSFKELCCNQTHDKPLITRPPTRNPCSRMAYFQTCKSLHQLFTMITGKAGLNPSSDTELGWYQGNLTHVYICWHVENLIFSLLLQKIKYKPWLACLYAAMKIFIILIWKIQWFYRIRRNWID